MELILMAAALLVLVGFIALGVEDGKYHREIEAASPIRLTIAVTTTGWDDSLPKRRSPAWAQEATA